MALVIEALFALAREGALPLAVKGDCMEPALASGSRVRVLARRRYWPGDVVAFVDDGGRVVLHRVIGLRRGGALLTQADRAAAPDSAVPRERVLGCVPGPTPFAARLAALLRFARFAGARLAARLP